MKTFYSLRQTSSISFFSRCVFLCCFDVIFGFFLSIVLLITFLLKYLSLILHNLFSYKYNIIHLHFVSFSSFDFNWIVQNIQLLYILHNVSNNNIRKCVHTQSKEIRNTYNDITDEMNWNRKLNNNSKNTKDWKLIEKQNQQSKQ